MKKTLAIISIIIIIVTTLLGCGSKDSSTETVKNNVQSETSNEPTLTNFKAYDIEGNEVSENIFSDYDLTMVNIWATWCTFCISEMPEIGELYAELPDNVNIITICDDASDDLDLTKKILSESNAEFTTLQGNDTLRTNIIGYVKGFPTTVFVDSTGKLVGKTQVGAPAAEGKIAQAYLSLINENLDLVNQS